MRSVHDFAPKTESVPTACGVRPRRPSGTRRSEGSRRLREDRAFPSAASVTALLGRLLVDDLPIYACCSLQVPLSTCASAPPPLIAGYDEGRRFVPRAPPGARHRRAGRLPPPSAAAPRAGRRSPRLDICFASDPTLPPAWSFAVSDRGPSPIRFRAPSDRLPAQATWCDKKDACATVKGGLPKPAWWEKVSSAVG